VVSLQITSTFPRIPRESHMHIVYTNLATRKRRRTALLMHRTTDNALIGEFCGRRTTKIRECRQPSFALRATEGTLLRVRQSRPSAARSAKQGGGDGRVNSPRRCSISGPFVPPPPFFPRRRARRLHPCALSPEGDGAGRAAQRTSVHAHAWHVVELPPRDQSGASLLVPRGLITWACGK
jgi:hypothetical protein